MITGVVNARHEVVIDLPVRDATGQQQAVEVMIDTGFDGSLTLPPATIADLGLIWRSRSRAVLADGNVEYFDIYIATIVWDGKLRPVLVQAVDNVPLLGMSLLVGHDVRFRAVVGGAVQIEAVP